MNTHRKGNTENYIIIDISCIAGHIFLLTFAVCCGILKKELYRRKCHNSLINRFLRQKTGGILFQVQQIGGKPCVPNVPNVPSALTCSAM